MSDARALLLTGEPVAGPRLLFALRWARSLGHPRPPVVVALERGAGGDGAAVLAAAGVHLRPLERGATVTAEGALRGLCRALDVRDILLWDSPMALALVPALRDLPSRPRVSAHLAPAEAVGWDEAAHVAVRGRNAVDVHLVEDDRTAEELERFELGPLVRRVALDPGPAPAEPPRDGGGWAVVEGATWRRARRGASAVAERLVASAPRTRAIPVEELIASLVRRDPPARVVFPDPDLPTAAPVLALAEAGARVHVSTGAVESALLAAGLARPLAELVP